MRAYVCDVTGEMLEGEAKRAAIVEVNETMRFTVVAERREGPGKTWRTGHLSPKAEEAIGAAMQAMYKAQQPKGNGGGKK